MRYIAAVVLASTLVASQASAVEMITLTNKGGGSRDDIEITFNNPPGKLTADGHPFTPINPADPNKVRAVGFKIAADGNINIAGLGLAHMGHRGQENSHVVAWCFSSNGSCIGSDGPIIVHKWKEQTIDKTLEQLNAMGIGVYSVPEPATWLTMMCGFAAVGTALRLRKRLVVAIQS